MIVMIKADPFFGRSWVRFRVPPAFRTQLHVTTSLSSDQISSTLTWSPSRLIYRMPSTSVIARP